MKCHIKVNLHEVHILQICMELHIDVYNGSFHKVHMKVSRGIEVCMKDLIHWSLLSVHLCNLKIYIKVCSESHSRDCPKRCIQSLCLQITFMFGGHIASKFAQIFTLKTKVRLPCCLQITLSITILIQNKLHSGSNKKHQKKKKSTWYSDGKQ